MKVSALGTRLKMVVSVDNGELGFSEQMELRRAT